MFEALFRWQTLYWVMLFLYVPCCVGLIIVVLLQKGKGVGFAGAFGLGAGSDTVFGPRTSQSLPVRLTHTMAILFMVLAFLMSLIQGRLSVADAPEIEEEPVVDAFGTLEEQGLGSDATEGEGLTDNAMAPDETASDTAAETAPAIEVTPAEEAGEAVTPPATDAPEAAPDEAAEAAPEAGPEGEPTTN